MALPTPGGDVLSTNPRRGAYCTQFTGFTVNNGATTQVPLNATSQDDGSFATLPTITVPAGLAGMYLVAGWFLLNTLVNGPTSMTLRRNGIEIGRDSCARDTFGNPELNPVALVALVPGDVIDAQVFQQTGGNRAGCLGTLGMWRIAA